MSDPKSVPFGKDLYCEESAPSNKEQEKPASSVVMLNGVPVPTTFADKCRLCLGDKFDKNSTNIIEEQFSRMLQKTFSFPIANKIGLPMNVCGKCFRKVRIFEQYSNIVWNNQRRLEESLRSAAALQNNNNLSSTVLAAAESPAIDQGQEAEEVIDIASDDESSKETGDETIGKEDETMDADLPGVTITADARNDPLVEPPDVEDAEQPHFVSVATQDDYFFYNEVVGIETFDTPHTDFIQEVSLVIELESSNDEESADGSEVGNRKTNSRRKNAKRVQNNVPKAQSFSETRLQAKAVADAMKSVNKSKKSKR